MAKITGAQMILKCLKAEGVEVVFGYPGGKVIPLYDALFDSDIKRMFEVLRISDAKISDKMISAVEERVTNIRRYLDRDVEFSEARDALVKGFEESFDIELTPGELTKEEENLVKELHEKYSSRNWVYQR